LVQTKLARGSIDELECEQICRVWLRANDEVNADCFASRSVSVLCAEAIHEVNHAASQADGCDTHGVYQGRTSSTSSESRSYLCGSRRNTSTRAPPCCGWASFGGARGDKGHATVHRRAIRRISSLAALGECAREDNVDEDILGSAGTFATEGEAKVMPVMPAEGVVCPASLKQHQGCSSTIKCQEHRHGSNLSEGRASHGRPQQGVLSFHQAKECGMHSPNFSLNQNLSAEDERGLEVDELVLIMAEHEGIDFDEARAELVRRQMARAGIDPETGLPPGIDPNTGLVLHTDE
jgi:hypothetical protein